MKIKRSVILSLEQVLTGMLETPMAPELSFKIASNVVAVSEVAEKIKKSYQPVEGFDVYESERRKLLEEIAGASPNGQYQLTPEQAKEFNEKLLIVDEEYKDVIEKQKAYAEKFEAMLEKDHEINVEKIDIKDMKANIEPAKMVILVKSGILEHGDK